MSTSNGQECTSEVLNAAYLSRISDSGTTAIIALQNPSSGGSVTNTQQAINDNTSGVSTNAASIASNDADITALDGRVTTLEGNAAPLNDFAATSDPGATEDSDDGYSVGSIIINVTLKRIWQAVDVTVGAAIWKRLDKIMFNTVLTAQLDFSSNNVTTAGYTEFIADTGSDVIRKIEFFYPDGDAMILAVGAAASEVDTAFVLAGGNELEVEIPANSRISFKLAPGGVDNTSGILSANLKAEA